MPPSPVNRDPATGMPMGEKIRTYFLGFAIGLAMVVMMLLARWRMQAQAQSTQPPGPSATNPANSLPTGPR